MADTLIELNMKICSIKNCNNPKRARGWCTRHYKRWQTTGNPNSTLWEQRKANRPTICTIDNCSLDVLYMGFCSGHYRRWIVHGNPTYSSLRTQKHGLKTCTVDGCNNPHNAKGLCNTHYNKMKNYGDVNGGKEKDSRVSPFGYVYLGSKMEHRIVMEEFLGRKLLPNENVHHRNGDRQDNRIKNLELWSRSQPYGQRVEDKINYAIEILEQYAPNLLKENSNVRSSN